MAPAVAGVDWYWEDSATPLVITKPASFGPGQILVAAFIQHNNPSFQTDLTTSADWNLEGNIDGTLIDGKIFSHVYDPADPATWSFTYRSTADVCMGVFRITGADVAPVLTVTSTYIAASTASEDSPTVTPAGSDDLLLDLIACHGGGAPFSVTDPSGMTTLGQTQVSGLYMALAAASQALVSGAATGVRTWTSVSPTGTAGGTWSIAVKSPATPDPLDPLVNVAPPPWLMLRIAQAQVRTRPGDLPLPGQLETGSSPLALTSSGTATNRIANQTGGTSLPLRAAGAATRTDVYVAAAYSSFQGDGLGDGSAITTGPVVSGDYLVVAVTDSQNATPPTAPGGWTEITIPDTDQSTAFEVHVYQLHNPAASTTYTWTVVGGRRTIVGALVRNASATALVDVASSLETATGTTHLSPTVTTTGPNRCLIAFDVLRSFPTCAWSQASGWLQYMQAVGGDGTTNMQVSLQSKLAPTATSYSDTFTCASSEPAIVVLIAAQAAAGATAETGTGSLPMRAAGTAVKTASCTGRAGLTLAGRGTQNKVVLDVGAATMPLRAAATGVKVAPDAGRASLTLLAAGAERKTSTPTAKAPLPLRAAGSGARTAVEAGRASLTLAAAGSETTGTARAQAGTSAVTLTGQGGARRTALPAGTAEVALRGAASAGKTVSRAGTAAAVLTASGAETVGSSRAQSGSARIPMAARGAARKTSAPTAGAALAASCAGTVRRLASSAGRAPVVLRSVTTPAKAVAQQSRAILALAARNAVGAGHSCSTPRPSTGTTTRPNSGTTAYNLTTTARPNSGTTTRPNTGVTTDPC